MSTSYSPVPVPHAMEHKDSPRLQQTPKFIPANHMPKRQTNSLPFRDSILHIPLPNTHETPNSSNPQSTLRGACDPMRRNIADELEHSGRLPAVYEEDGAMWTVGRGTAVLPGVPYLSSQHSDAKPWQGSPSTTDRALRRHLPPLVAQTAAEYRRRNLVMKFKTPFSHEHGVWDDLPMDLEAVARAQKRGAPPSNREQAGKLLARLLGREEAQDQQYKCLGGSSSRGDSIDSCFNNDLVGTPAPHSTVARTRSLELRRELHHL
jgi:hypothetical protein